MTPFQSSFWDREKTIAWEFLDDLIMDTMLQGQSSGVQLLPEAIRPLISWETVNEAALDFLRNYRLSTINGIVETSRRQTLTAIRQWIEAGDSLDVLINRLAPIYGNRRAATIAATEVTRIYAHGNQMVWQSTGVVGGKRWMTARDERVCFPAWTTVSTKTGLIPIQKVKVGDMAFTRQGLRRVKAINKRLYNGEMTEIKTNNSVLISTSDHPIWHSKKGWLYAGDFVSGDGVYSINDEIMNIDNVVNFNIGNTNNRPASTRKKFVFSAISPGGVPINPVNFQSYSVFGEGEINRVSSNFSFLNVLNTNVIKDKSYTLFQSVFASILPVAGNRTKLTSLAGGISKFFPAIFAGFYKRGATTLLGTIMAFIAFFAMLKMFAATLARRKSNTRVPALNTANGIPVGNGSLDFKFFSTNRTKFFNHFRGAAGFIASAGTKLSLSRFLNAGKWLPTIGTGVIWNRFSLSKPVTFPRAINSFVFSFLRPIKWLVALVANISKRHVYQLLTRYNVLYHRLSGSAIYVYDIQVEDVPEFYANGILVHNCPICGPLDGQVVQLDNEFGLSPLAVAESPQMRQLLGNNYTPEAALRRSQSVLKSFGGGVQAPPAHVNCRCWLQPFVSEVAFQRQVGDILAGQFFADVRAGRITGVTIG